MLFFLLCLIFHARCFSCSFNYCKLFATSPSFPLPAVGSASVPKRSGLQPLAGPKEQSAQPWGGPQKPPQTQAALEHRGLPRWLPGAFKHLCVCAPGRRDIPAPGHSSWQTAGGSQAPRSQRVPVLVNKPWHLHPWQHIVQHEMRSSTPLGNRPGSREALLKPRTKDADATQSRCELDLAKPILLEHHFLHPRRFMKVPHESPTLTKHLPPPPRQGCPPRLSSSALC